MITDFQLAIAKEIGIETSKLERPISMYFDPPATASWGMAGVTTVGECIAWVAVSPTLPRGVRRREYMRFLSVVADSII